MKGKILYSYFPGGPWYDPTGTTSGRDWSLVIECQNPMDAESLVRISKDILQIYPWATARLDGRWPVVLDSPVILAQLDVFFSGGITKVSEAFSSQITAGIGEACLRLDGGWVLGINGGMIMADGLIYKDLSLNGKWSVVTDSNILLSATGWRIRI
ncbi:hypothetical protein DO021_19630 [Desulfobacter hydrogenophilus]|uniref:Uncharacterized protein n=1 Tax=Desulfobacter hydrogenophilus TaxID=2291 RepID=A0A328F9K5_9BACT|nr:hypothetical protein [Desulfobacter hydrogenophilus]NDY73983.1 hypothetical protein [Desulfobacter hydrogenophilus]QBH14328.1 hypothetical protein EYB58_16230 [Desulfobacter hydrogenophilus]RAM00330.1 hypothetical protein DO021_19630 [Desulfobacter hydrogenophilus]